MPKYKKLLLEAFKPAFKERGFTKKASTWFRETDEMIQVFNVQTSQWSETYYFNAAVYFKALGKEKTPPEHRCHIRERLPPGGDDKRAIFGIDELADFERVSQAVARKHAAELSDLITPMAFQWLDRFRDLTHVKRELRKGGIECVRVEVWPLFGLKEPEFVEATED